MQKMATKRLGMLTPSSNSVLEPVTTAMLHDVADVSVHFSRFRVLRISLDSDALQQFTNDPMLEAAQLLADARTDVICWNGTSSGWLGFDSDEDLCHLIRQRSGTPACTSVLALNEILKLTHANKIAFVTPYIDEIQSAIIKNYSEAGFEVVAEEHLQDAGNFSFSTYTEQKIIELCRKVAVHKPQAICIFCTNFRGAAVARLIEQETGIPVYDTIATALWKSLRLSGVDPSVVTGWGSVFNVK